MIKLLILAAGLLPDLAECCYLERFPSLLELSHVQVVYSLSLRSYCNCLMYKPLMYDAYRRKLVDKPADAVGVHIIGGLSEY